VAIALSALLPASAQAAFTITLTETADSGAGHATYTGNFETATAGNLILACLSGDANITTITWPGSWVEIADLQDGGGNVTLSCAYLFAAGGESSVAITAAGTTDQMGFHIWRIQGAHASQAPEITTLQDAGAGGAETPDPPSETASWGVEANLFITVLAIAGAATVDAYPSGYSNGDHLDCGGGGCGIASARKEAVAATDDPGTFDLSAANDFVVATIVVRSAATRGAPMMQGIIR
jgi:hypothetical protein